MGQNVLSHERVGIVSPNKAYWLKPDYDEVPLNSEVIGECVRKTMRTCNVVFPIPPKPRGNELGLNEACNEGALTMADNLQGEVAKKILKNL
jgi:hypothetical protein